MTITKIKHDVNGNPRRVVHYLEFITKADYWDENGNWNEGSKYNLAINRAKKFGGKKYHTKGFGGGIVFQSYSDEEVEGIVNQARASL
jgi:hypothetical protein